jgi:PAS domain S-box-containing protein
MNNLPRVLIIDENANDRALASLVLTGEFGNLEIDAVGTAAEFAGALAAGRFGIVISEAVFSWSTGLELIRLVREVRPDCPVILFTAEVGEELWGETLRLDVDGYVSKSSAGFVRLPAVVRSVFFRTRRKAVATSRDAPYRRLVEGLPVGVFVATLEGEILEANPAFASMLGLFDPEEAAWKTFPSLFAEAELADEWRDRMATTRSVRNLDIELKRADGSLVWTRVSSWVVEDAGSGMRHIQGIVEETADYHAAQKDLADRTDALARSNDELEHFAYVVSHDLQQPLSVVSSYLEMLGDSVRDRLEDEEESYLDRASSSAVRVQEMVDAVLGFARVDSRGGDFGPVDLGATLDQVKTELWKEITVAKAEITSEGLPTVVADEAQMELLLQNLISNALKFSGGPPAEIHLSSEENEDEWTISVRDNGIGIDPGASDRIFVMFQRLHTEKEIPGTGIGLAICKRIIDRHGGKIWVESEQLLLNSCWDLRFSFRYRNERPVRTGPDRGFRFRFEETLNGVYRIAPARVGSGIADRRFPRPCRADLHEAQEVEENSGRCRSCRSFGERSPKARTGKIRRRVAGLLPAGQLWHRDLPPHSPGGAENADHRPDQP